MAKCRAVMISAFTQDNLFKKTRVGGKIQREGPYVYLWLIHTAVWQKPTHHKTISFQFKKKKKKTTNRKQGILVNKPRRKVRLYVNILYLLKAGLYFPILGISII